MRTAVDFAKELIEFESVSSRSNVPITDHIEKWLREWGMETERVNYTDPAGVEKSNLIARLGTGTGGIAYFGHTDVVPAVNWLFDDFGPFEPTIKEGRLYGRGSCDMKGSIACMLAAIESALSKPLSAPIYFCCTADEEVGMLGAEYVAQSSKLYRDMVDGSARGIVGEPTCFEVIYAHKGGCGLRVTATGKAAHSSTRNGVNANWQMIPFLMEMKAFYEELETDSRWQNPLFDPPTVSLNLGINDFNGAMNITSPQSICTLYFRAMPEIDADGLLKRIHDSAERHGLQVTPLFRAIPFFTDPESDYVRECLEFSSAPQARTVSYGTDAARFRDLTQCVVMGPGNIAQAHTHDEWISLDDLKKGTQLFQQMIQRWCL